MKRIGNALHNGVQILFHDNVIIFRLVPAGIQHIPQLQGADGNTLGIDDIFSVIQGNTDTAGTNISEERILLFHVLHFVQGPKHLGIDQCFFLIVLQHLYRHIVLDFQLIRYIGPIFRFPKRRSGHYLDLIHPVPLYHLGIAPENSGQLPKAFKADFSLVEYLVTQMERTFQMVHIHDLSFSYLCDPHFQHMGANIDDCTALTGLFLVHE